MPSVSLLTGGTLGLLTGSLLGVVANGLITCPANESRAMAPPGGTVTIDIAAVKTLDNSSVKWGMRACYDIFEDPGHPGFFLDCLHNGDQNTSSPLANRFADCSDAIAVGTPAIHYSVSIDVEAKYLIFYPLENNATSVEWFGAAENQTTGVWEWETHDCFCNNPSYCPDTACA